jgi:hypothetical protein
MSDDDDDQDLPKSKLIRMISYIIKIKELVLAIVAIITALVGWFKPPDTKITQTSYEILSVKMNEIAKATENNHDDIQSLRSYLDGYTKGEARKTASFPSATSSMSTPTVPPIQVARISLFSAIKNSVNSTPKVRAAAEMAEIAEESEVAKAPTPASAPAAPPEISPRPASAAPPPFAQVVESASAR